MPAEDGSNPRPPNGVEHEYDYYQPAPSAVNPTQSRAGQRNDTSEDTETLPDEELLDALIKALSSDDASATEEQPEGE